MGQDKIIKIQRSQIKDLQWEYVNYTKYYKMCNETIKDYIKIQHTKLELTVIQFAIE